jgi:transaldolase
MAFYLDSARVEDANAAHVLGWVRGITTNPTLLKQSDLPSDVTLRLLASALPGEICYQLTAPDLEGMLAEGWAASSILGEQSVLKIPATAVGFQALARLSKRIPCAVTAIFSPAQALVAAAAGARYIIPYVNRSTRLLGDGPALVREMAQALAGSPTQILAASIKSPEEAVAAHLAGAHHLSLPLEILQAMTGHELTGASVSEFTSKGTGIGY